MRAAPHNLRLGGGWPATEAAPALVQFRAAAMGKAETTQERIEQTVADLLPSTSAEAVDRQSIAAIWQGTSRVLFPVASRGTPRDDILARLHVPKNPGRAIGDSKNRPCIPMMRGR